MTEKKHLYTMYCQVASSLYSYAQSEELRAKKQVVWSITTYYYSIVYAARFLCYLSFRKYPTGHPELRKLFLGENLTNKWSWSLSGNQNESYDYDLFKNSLANYSITEDVILKIGKYLKSLSELRNDGNYEGFIIANQVNHNYLQPLMERALQIHTYYSELIELVLSAFLGYCNNQGAEFIGFINDTNSNKQWAFKDLFEQLQAQKFSKRNINKIKGFVSKFVYKKSASPLVVPESFFNEISFDNFIQKQEKMREFEQHLNALKNIEEHP